MQVKKIEGFKKQMNSIVFEVELMNGEKQQMTANEMKIIDPLKLIEFYESKIRVGSNKKQNDEQ